MKQLPEDFFNLSGREQFQIGNYANENIHIYLSFTTEKRIPAKYASYRDTMAFSNSALYDEIKLNQEAIQAIARERDGVKKLVITGINNATTLKRLLEMMPEIEMFIPEHAMQTHYAKTEPKIRKKSEKVNVEVGTDQKVAMAKVKMFGSINSGDD